MGGGQGMEKELGVLPRLQAPLGAVSCPLTGPLFPSRVPANTRGLPAASFLPVPTQPVGDPGAGLSLPTCNMAS